MKQCVKGKLNISSFFAKFLASLMIYPSFATPMKNHQRWQKIELKMKKRLVQLALNKPIFRLIPGSVTQKSDIGYPIYHLVRPYF